MPTSSSPNGIHADCPLQRAWMILLSSGSRRRKAATVRGATSSSRRAAKRKSPETISSTGNPASDLAYAHPKREGWSVVGRSRATRKRIHGRGDGVAATRPDHSIGRPAPGSVDLGALRDPASEEVSFGL